MLTGCVLITGTSRGIGLEFVRQLVKRSSITPKHIIATCRKPNEATELLQLRDEHPEVVVVKELDITEYDKGFKEFVQDIKPLTSSLGLGCLINNGGITNLTGLAGVKPKMMNDCFNVNVVAPLMLTKALHKEMRYPEGSSGGQYELKKPLIVNIGAILGSIGLNDKKKSHSEGGYYPYRVSKAGMHMLTKNFALDLAKDGINVIGVHPGWLKTRMGGKMAPTTVEEGVAGMIDNLMLGFDEARHNGNLFDYLGKELEW